MKILHQAIHGWLANAEIFMFCRRFLPPGNKNSGTDGVGSSNGRDSASAKTPGCRLNQNRALSGGFFISPMLAKNCYRV
jgi:hypothetical protein